MSIDHGATTVRIRPIQPADAARAGQIWVDGLQQTMEACPAEKREAMQEHFEKTAQKECAEGGIVGINGKGLIDFWCDETKDCCMFVAVRGDEDEVLGLVGVKRGMDYTTFPTDASTEDYSLFSIWKLSVAFPGRRLGIGLKLMNAAEAWAREQDAGIGKKIRLYTANPVAASFYTSEKLGYTETKKTDHYGIYEKGL